VGWFSRKPIDPLADRVSAGDVVFHASHVRIRSSATDLRVPGAKRASRAVSLHRGSVLVTSDHLAISYRKWIAIDGRLRVDPAATAQVTFDAEGVHVTIDITKAMADVPRKHSGVAVIDVAAPIPPEALERLTARAVAVSPVQVSGIARRI